MTLVGWGGTIAGLVWSIVSAAAAPASGLTRSSQASEGMPEFEGGGGVCPSCYSNHATNPNVLCSRARDQFVLLHGPAYFDECAERIFQEFTRSRAVERCHLCAAPATAAARRRPQ